LPSDSSLVTDPSEIAALWSDNLPAGDSNFKHPPAVLDITVSAANPSITFYDLLPSIQGPVELNGSVIDPLIPGASVPEPSTWALMLVGFGGLGLAALRKVEKGRRAIKAA
jgi:hypothetical protein